MVITSYEKQPHQVLGNVLILPKKENKKGKNNKQSHDRFLLS